jgi:hypothetical protein
MGEAEWLNCTHPEPMLGQLPGDEGERRARLFACACTRLVWHLLGAECRRAVESVERLADEGARKRWRHPLPDLTATLPPLGRLPEGPTYGPRDWRAAAGHSAARAVREAVGTPRPSLGQVLGRVEEALAQELWTDRNRMPEEATLAVRATRAGFATLLRCVFGNPYRSLPARTPPTHVVGLARSCSENLPAVSPDFLILADALDDLGEAEAAGHCRLPAHAKGCHVLDWVLGKE